MSEARDNILQRIRQANQRYTQSDANEVIRHRLQTHSRGPQPQWQEELQTRFIRKVEQSAASFQYVSSQNAIIEAVMSYIVEQSVGPALVRSATPLLNQLQWPATVRVEKRAVTIEDKIVLVEAFAGIAETGSVVMCSSEQAPVSLNFLPDHFLCVVHVSSVVARMEDVWERMRREGIRMPRAINIITGPSRTADVEQVIQMGAHGPRRVHLLLWDHTKHN